MASRQTSDPWTLPHPVIQGTASPTPRSLPIPLIRATNPITPSLLPVSPLCLLRVASWIPSRPLAGHGCATLFGL